MTDESTTEKMTIYEVLETIGLPCVYSHFKDAGDTPIAPPYIAYIGSGQDTMGADNTHYWRNNLYQIEYYFKEKDEELETTIEDVRLENGYNYTQSEDVYIETEGVFVIYYNV